MSERPRHVADRFPGIWGDLEWSMLGARELKAIDRENVEREIAARLADIEATQEAIEHLFERDEELADDADDEWYWDDLSHRRTMLAESIVGLGRRIAENEERIRALRLRLAVWRQVG